MSVLQIMWHRLRYDLLPRNLSYRERSHDWTSRQYLLLYKTCCSFCHMLLATRSFRSSPSSSALSKLRSVLVRAEGFLPAFERLSPMRNPNASPSVAQSHTLAERSFQWQNRPLSCKRRSRKSSASCTYQKATHLPHTFSPCLGVRSPSAVG